MSALCRHKCMSMPWGRCDTTTVEDTVKHKT